MIDSLTYDGPPSSDAVASDAHPAGGFSADTATNLSSFPGAVVHESTPVCPSIDTMGFTDTAAFASGTPAWREATATQVFGAQSLLIPSVFSPAVPSAFSPIVPPVFSPAPPPRPLTASPALQLFVLLLAMAYLTLLYRNATDLRAFVVRAVREKSDNSRSSDEAMSGGFSHLLNAATLIGLFLIGVLVVRCDAWLGVSPGVSLGAGLPIERLPHTGALLLCLLAGVAVAGVFLFEIVALRIAGAVILSAGFARQIVALKRTCFALTVLVAAPLVLLFALTPPQTGRGWFWAIICVAALTTVLFLMKLLRLFLVKKVSILYWFLYLCTVEVFPISLLWLLTVR